MRNQGRSQASPDCARVRLMTHGHRIPSVVGSDEWGGRSHSLDILPAGDFGVVSSGTVTYATNGTPNHPSAWMRGTETPGPITLKIKGHGRPCESGIPGAGPTTQGGQLLNLYTGVRRWPYLVDDGAILGA